ncbi:DUF6300 family protein [Streptomyces sp. DSM 44915]|uniref:DUF6300 family protein n=1 Tax=Streptomyces chisholmiae TaxID=3075540 RepID=A0ABU2JUT7_9ACTN|nr:DUF6300 family protein [Streptomyces sp. DSM 44915]MDT0268509.1 DUF6300 family protein [Streptomyces sp. DSM 44915]
MTTEAVDWRRATTPPCPRCARPAALTARYPHRWRNAAGAWVEGWREALLCGHCDGQEATARPLLTLLASEQGVGAPELTRLGPLVTAWLAAVGDRTPEWGRLAAEAARWRAGDL